MHSIYIREQEPLKLDKIISKISIEGVSWTVDELKKVLAQLAADSIVKKVKSEVEDLDISEIDLTHLADVDDEDGVYKFCFVGAIIVGIADINGNIKNGIFKIYPKYIHNNPAPEKDFKKVMRVIQKYRKSKPQEIGNLDKYDNATYNEMNLWLSIIDNYYAEGLYSKDHRTNELNGAGEICWDKTINNTMPLFAKGEIVYADVVTKKRVNNNNDFFHRLHRCILTSIYNELDEYGLADLLDLEPIELSEDDMDNFGEQEQLLLALQSELCVQFATQKQTMLKMMSAYIEKKGNLRDEKGYSIYGSNSFNIIWEELHKKILGDDYGSDPKLQAAITPATFTSYDGNTEELSKRIPDIVVRDTLIKNDMCIYDAKYYDIRNTIVSGVKTENEIPGIESIDKQHIYELFYKKAGFNVKKNAFLFPCESDLLYSCSAYMASVSKGSVSKGSVSKGSVSIGSVESPVLKGYCKLQPIELICIDANDAYSCYLDNKRLIIL